MHSFKCPYKTDHSKKELKFKTSTFKERDFCSASSSWRRVHCGLRIFRWFYRRLVWLNCLNKLRFKPICRIFIGKFDTYLIPTGAIQSRLTISPTISLISRHHPNKRFWLVSFKVNTQITDVRPVHVIPELNANCLIRFHPVAQESRLVSKVSSRSFNIDIRTCKKISRVYFFFAFVNQILTLMNETAGF